MVASHPVAQIQTGDDPAPGCCRVRVPGGIGVLGVDGAWTVLCGPPHTQRTRRLDELREPMRRRLPGSDLKSLRDIG